jgi:hypothetical protein
MIGIATDLSTASGNVHLITTGSAIAERTDPTARADTSATARNRTGAGAGLIKVATTFIPRDRESRGISTASQAHTISPDVRATGMDSLSSTLSRADTARRGGMAAIAGGKMSDTLAREE